MLKHLGLQNDWKLVKVLKSTERHAVLLIRRADTGSSEIVKVLARRNYDSKAHHVLSQLSDKNLLPINRIQTYRNWKLVFFPLLTPLNEYIRQNGLSLSEILQLTKDISMAISAMHEKHLLHLDISPDNIFVDENNQFRLGDFCNVCWEKDSRLITSVTPDYAAPECLNGHATAASDQYSFAMLLFALLHHGSIPKGGQKNTAFSHAQKKALANGIAYPSTLYSCFSRALSPAPSTRYSDCLSFAKEIETCLLPLCEETEYRLHLTDKSHPFFQTQTISCEEKNSRIHKFSRKGIIAAALSLSLLAAVGVRCLPTFTSTNPADKSSNSSAPVASPQHSSSESSVLDISNQNADTLTELLGDAPPLQSQTILYGENNCFSSLEGLADYPHIRELYLSGNEIDNLDDIATLQQLEILILSDNVCHDLQPLSSLTNLSVLDLSGNPELSDIDCLCGLSSLQILILTDTAVSAAAIESLQAAIPDCTIIN